VTIIELDRARGRPDAARRDVERGGGLVDRPAAALDRGRQPAHELRRLHPRAVRRVARAAQAGDARARGGLVDVEQLAARRLAQARELGLGLRDGQRAALDEVAVDALAGAGRAHLVDRRLDRALERRDRVLTGCLALARAGRDLAEHPAAVAPRGAEAGHLPLEHDDGERGVGPQQLVGGPQAGVAGSDDADVGLAVAVEGGAGGGKAAEVGPPPRRRVGHSANPDMSLTRAGLE
jgi:hypothetical protein